MNEVAEALTFVMFRVFKAIGPSELHDGAWQVCVWWGVVDVCMDVCVCVCVCIYVYICVYMCV